jgi:simple sugar transport system permease protein
MSQWKQNLWFALQRPEIGTILGVILLLSIFIVASQGLFLSGDNLRAVVRVAAQLGIITVGQALLMITGEFDLSVGAVFGFAGVLFIALVKYVGITLSFIIVLLIVVAIGFFNGIFVFKLKVPSLIATLGAQFIYRGLIYFGTGGFGISLPSGMKDAPLVKVLGGKLVGDFNNIFGWFILAVIVFNILLTRTRYGNRAFAVGDEPLSAFSRGISTVKIKWIAFMICSSLAGLAGMATVCNTGAAHPTLGQQLELESIAATVVGGVVLTGGSGSIWGAAIGAFFLSTIKSGLILMGAPPYWFITFVGVVLIAAVAVNGLVFTSKRY